MNPKSEQKETNLTNNDSNVTLVRSIGYLANITRKDIERSLCYFDITSKSKIIENNLVTK